MWNVVCCTGFGSVCVVSDMCVSVWIVVATYRDMDVESLYRLLRRTVRFGSCRGSGGDGGDFKWQVCGRGMKSKEIEIVQV